MDIPKIVQIGEVKKKNLFQKIKMEKWCIHPRCYEAPK